VDTTLRNLEASSELDIPPRSWARIVRAAATLSSQLFPRRSVALNLVDDAAITALNYNYRGVKQATDILSFPDEDGSTHAGDLALSWETVQRQAKVNHNSVEDESIALIAHGLLHLAGYEHDSDEGEAEMHARTLELLAALRIDIKVFGHE
jgi:probable rRNA maturation factor